MRLKKGQRLAADVRSASLSAGGGARVSVRAPDGETFGFVGVGDPASGWTSPPAWVESSFTATQDGVWTVVVDPFQATTGSVSLVVRVADDQVIRGRLGRSTTITVEKPGQNVILPFDVPQGSAASTVRWQLSGSTFAHAQLRLLTPFGGQWDVADLPPGSSGGSLSLPSFFPGTWTLVVDPVDGAVGRATLTFRLA